MTPDLPNQPHNFDHVENSTTASEHSRLSPTRCSGGVGAVRVGRSGAGWGSIGSVSVDLKVIFFHSMYLSLSNDTGLVFAL